MLHKLKYFHIQWLHNMCEMQEKSEYHDIMKFDVL